MLKHTSVFAGIAGLVFATAPPVQADHPAELGPGDTYHWAFVTSTSRDATSTDIADYDAHVQAAADAGSESSSLGLTWKAIASTDSVDAGNHVGVSGPIYLLDGTKVADGAAHFWGTTDAVPDPNKLHWGITFTENGVDLKDSGYLKVWTGTNADGKKADGTWEGEAGWPLGHTPEQWPMYGDINGWEHRFNCHWITEYDDVNPSTALPLYALSEAITIPVVTGTVFVIR